MFQQCYEMTGKNDGQRVNTISKNGLGLVQSKKILCYFDFVCLFCKSCWAPHTEWMHRIDERSKKFGHSAHNVPVRVQIMNDDINHDVETWNTSPKYRSFVDKANTLPADVAKRPGKETTLRQARVFFSQYQKTFKEYYTQYFTSLLPFLLSLGVANLVLQNSQDGIQGNRLLLYLMTKLYTIALFTSVMLMYASGGHFSICIAVTHTTLGGTDLILRIGGPPPTPCEAGIQKFVKPPPSVKPINKHYL